MENEPPIDGLQAAVQALIPKSLDDIIRANREIASLALSTELELEKLHTQISAPLIRDEVSNWQFISLRVNDKEVLRIIVFLLGRIKPGEAWMTSQVTGVDMDSGLVKTSNSVYKLMGNSASEAELDLVHVCATFHKWGFGTKFGVPEFFY